MKVPMIDASSKEERVPSFEHKEAPEKGEEIKQTRKNYQLFSLLFSLIDTHL